MYLQIPSVQTLDRNRATSLIKPLDMATTIGRLSMLSLNDCAKDQNFRGPVSISLQAEGDAQRVTRSKFYIKCASCLKFNPSANISCVVTSKEVRSKPKLCYTVNNFHTDNLSTRFCLTRLDPTTFAFNENLEWLATLPVYRYKHITSISLGGLRTLPVCKVLKECSGAYVSLPIWESIENAGASSTHAHSAAMEGILSSIINCFLKYSCMTHLYQSLCTAIEGYIVLTDSHTKMGMPLISLTSLALFEIISCFYENFIVLHNDNLAPAIATCPESKVGYIADDIRTFLAWSMICRTRFTMLMNKEEMEQAKGSLRLSPHCSKLVNRFTETMIGECK